jgi:hypothetical protein
MTHRGWMVDDGTCDACWTGNCWLCTKPHEAYGDGEIALICCCDDGYRIGSVDLDDLGEP